MGKNTDKLGTLEDYRAPWETEAGTDAEIDKPKLKRLMFNLKLGEAKALDAKTEAEEKVTEAEADVAKYKKQAADSTGEEAQKALTKAEADLAAAKATVKKLETDIANRDLRSEVLAGVDPKVAKYVVGETKEELEKSLKEVKEDFGITDKPAGDDDNDGDDDDDFTHITPRSKVKTPLDKGGEGDSKEHDYAAFASEWIQ